MFILVEVVKIIQVRLRKEDLSLASTISITTGSSKSSSCMCNADTCVILKDRSREV